MNILAVVPARGGSKGIPRKNIRDLAGKPLIAWTLHAAHNTTHVLRTIVSTDDEEIAAVARAYGGEVPFMRPVEIAGDKATDVEFLNHALSELKSSEGYVPDIVLRLPPTSPLRTAEEIDLGIRTLLETKDADASRPVLETPKHPYKMWMVDGEGPFLKPFLSKEVTGYDEPHNLPRQLFPKVYIHTGAMDVMYTKTITEQQSTSGKHLAYFFTNPMNAINIDNPIDFDFADFLMRRRIEA